MSGHADYKGYRLVGGGIEKEEIICVDESGQPRLDQAGNVVKPLDFSITKVSAAIMIIVILLIVIVMVAKNGYKKRETHAEAQKRCGGDCCFHVIPPKVSRSTSRRHRCA